MINDLLVKLSLQHHITQQEVVKIQEKLPLVHKKSFSFELNENVEPSKFVVALMELYSQFKDQKKLVHPPANREKVKCQQEKEISAKSKNISIVSFSFDCILF
jgi:hypothetical protein